MTACSRQSWQKLGTLIPEIAQTFLAAGLQCRNLDSSQGFILIDLLTNLRNISLTGCASSFSLWTVVVLPTQSAPDLFDLFNTHTRRHVALPLLTTRPFHSAFLSATALALHIPIGSSPTSNAPDHLRRIDRSTNIPAMRTSLLS